MEPFGKQFPPDLFEHFATKYLNALWVGRVAQTCKALNARVNELSARYWIDQITLMPNNLGSSRKIIVKWLEREQDPKLSRVCCNTLIHCTGVDERMPSPVLCAVVHWGMKDLVLGKGDLQKIWNIIPECDRDKFYNYIKKAAVIYARSPDCIDHAEVYAEFIERGLCESIPLDDRVHPIKKLLKGMCRINAANTIKKLLTFPNINLTECLEDACQTTGNVQTIKTLIAAGANPAQMRPWTIGKLDKFHTNEKVVEILTIFYEAGADIDPEVITMFKEGRDIECTIL